MICKTFKTAWRGGRGGIRAVLSLFLAYSGKDGEKCNVFAFVSYFIKQYLTDGSPQNNNNNNNNNNNDNNSNNNNNNNKTNKIDCPASVIFRTVSCGAFD